MSFIRYHNITGSTGVDVQLIAPEENKNSLKSILLTNIHASNDATVSLFLNNQTRNTTYYIIHTVAVPADSSLLLDDSDILSFNNSEFGLYITVGSSDTVDVILS